MPKKSQFREKELVALCVKLLEDKHVQNLCAYDVREHSSITDYYLVGAVRNPRQMKAAGDNLTRQLKKRGVRMIHQDGQTTDNSWVVLDYLECIVHLFTEDTRAYYNIEELWQECDISLTSLPNIEDKLDISPTAK